MRVLVYSAVRPGDRAGVQTVVRRLVGHLRERGHAVVQAWGRPDPHAPESLALELPLVEWRGRLPAPRSLLAACRAAAKLAATLARVRPQVVNVHFVTAEALYFALLRPFLRYRLVLSVHGSDVLRPKPWNARLVPRLLRYADAITTVSHLTRAHVMGRGIRASRIRVVPNGIDPEFWGAPSPALADREPIVLTVGRLHPVKGQDVLLDALPLVRSRVPAARALIVGDGGYRAELERRVASLGLAPPAVEFAGPLEPAQVRAHMHRARVFVLCSRSEGLPLALLEAMAAGLPAVASRVGGVPEVMVPGTGVMVPSEDPAALADAIVDLLVHPDLSAQISSRAPLRAREFSATGASAAYEELFRGLSRSRHDRRRSAARTAAHVG